jgi:hypothetical protein
MFRHPGFLDSLRAVETSAEAYTLICDADREIGEQ